MNTKTITEKIPNGKQKSKKNSFKNTCLDSAHSFSKFQFK